MGRPGDERLGGEALRPRAHRVAEWERLKAEATLEREAAEREALLALGEPVRRALLDPDVTEVVLHGSGRTWASSMGLGRDVDLGFETTAARREAAIVLLASMCHKSVDPVERPRLSGRVDLAGRPVRVHALTGRLAHPGPLLVLRKLAGAPVTLRELEERGEMTQAQRIAVWAGFMGGRQAHVRGIVTEEQGARFERQMTVLVCGETGSGKTRFVGALLSLFGPGHTERIVALEDPRELMCRAPQFISLQVGVTDERGEYTARRAIEEDCMRLTPDRLILGEARRPADAVALMTALKTGHGGSVATMHAGSPAQAIARLHEWCERAEPGVHDARGIAAAIGIVVCMEKRGKRGAVRSVHLVEAPRPGEGGEVAFVEIA